MLGSVALGAQAVGPVRNLNLNNLGPAPLLDQDTGPAPFSDRDDLGPTHDRNREPGPVHVHNQGVRSENRSTRREQSSILQSGRRKRASDYFFARSGARVRWGPGTSGGSAAIQAEETRREQLAVRRNEKRLDRANDADSSLLGKYLSCTVDDFLPEVLAGPRDFLVPPSSFIKKVAEVANSPVPTPASPPIEFSTSEHALEKNSELLARFDYDLDQLLTAYSTTTLHPGSEFRPIEQLEKVLGSHPLFDSFCPILKEGMRYEFRRELSETERVAEL